MSAAHMTTISRSDKMPIIITSTILLSLLHSMGTSIYLLDTQDGSNIEHYDCLAISSLPYCRRPRRPIDLNRNDGSFSCNETNDGTMHRFSDLRTKNVSISTILHRWRSSIEQVEAYARYLRDQTQSDGYLCEYHMPSVTTLEETLDWQVKMRHENEWKAQPHDTELYERVGLDRWKAIEVE